MINVDIIFSITFLFIYFESENVQRELKNKDQHMLVNSVLPKMSRRSLGLSGSTPFLFKYKNQTINSTRTRKGVIMN